MGRRQDLPAPSPPSRPHTQGLVRRQVSTQRAVGGHAAGWQEHSAGMFLVPLLARSHSCSVPFPLALQDRQLEARQHSLLPARKVDCWWRS